MGKINRRTVVKGALAVGAAAHTLRVPAAVAQAGPIQEIGRAHV